MERININQLMARTFINQIQMAMTLDAAGPIIQLDRGTAFRFKMLSEAQMSCMYSMAALVTDKSLVFAEYDRMVDLLKQHTPDAEESPSLKVLEQARTSLDGILTETQRGH